MFGKVFVMFQEYIVVFIEEQFVVFADISYHTDLTNTGQSATCNHSRTWNRRKVEEIQTANEMSGNTILRMLSHPAIEQLTNFVSLVA